MKKLGLLLIPLVFVLAGCGKSQDTINTSAEPETPGYIFEVKGISISMNGEAAPILEELGKPKSYFEADSCAYQGKEKTNTYSGFELHTYEKDKKDYVLAIIFLDDSVSTKEGIALSSSLSDVKKAYGDKYKEELGLYTYELDKSKLSFAIENDEVASVEYDAIMK